MWRKEPSGPNRYLHYCPLSSQLVSASHSFPLPVSSLSLSPALTLLLLLHCLSRCICLSISCFNSLTSRAVILPLLFCCRERRRSRRGRTGSRFYKWIWLLCWRKHASETLPLCPDLMLIPRPGPKTDLSHGHSLICGFSDMSCAISLQTVR